MLRGFPGGLALLLEGFPGLPVVWEIHLRCVLAGRRGFGRRELDGEREGGDEIAQASVTDRRFPQAEGRSRLRG